MKIGAFEFDEPVPEIRDPYAIAMLRPWIDVNNVASLTLTGLELQFGAKELGRLAKPGFFFDFTRYRPTLYYEGGARRFKIPNATLSHAKREGENDLLFLRLLEPHSFSEVYVDSILRVLKTFKTKKYILLGSMYDAVPHTRPLIINGGAVGKETELELRKSGARSSGYQGPTSIVSLLTQRAPEMGIETIWFIVSLPQYVSLEEDYIGKVRLMETLNLLYNIPMDKEDFDRAIEQRELISQRLEKVSEMKNLLPQLETLYDLRIKKKEGEGLDKLSSEMEEMLWKIMGKDVGKA